MKSESFADHHLVGEAMSEQRAGVESPLAVVQLVDNGCELTGHKLNRHNYTWSFTVLFSSQSLAFMFDC